MKTLAIIPARGGSKRIPRKNVKEFLGKPILAYPIEAALKTGLFDEIMVSTDDPEISSVASTYGAVVPFMRSEENSNDFATLTDVLLEVLTKYKEQGKVFETVCCILPTAALIKPETINIGYNELIKNDISTLVPVVKYSYPIQRALVSEKSLLKMREIEHLATRSQDLNDCYHDSGQFYWINASQFFLEKNIFASKTGFIELKEYEVQDVDTLEDWAMMEIKFKYNLHIK